MNEFALMTFYVKYLKEIRQLSDTSVKHYQDALNYISKYLIEKNMLSKSIYEIQDIQELGAIKSFLISDANFVAMDRRGHQMYSAGFNNYYRFACGEEFSNFNQKIKLLDTEVPVGEQRTMTQKTWKRSSIIKLQSIESAGYLCEVDSNHHTFTAKSTRFQYMEGHHILPMEVQEKFSNSLDVYANIICVCPICHRLLHYGIDNEKEPILNKIYYDRSKRLDSSGLRISKEDFIKMIV